MKILLLDIETAPNKVYTWGLFKKNVSLNQIEEAGYTLCWAAKWLGDKKTHFMSVHTDGLENMLEGVYALLDEADVVVHYNGTKFDIPTLNREFLEFGQTPPSPTLEVDILRTVRNRFRFLSNKLDYVAQQLGCGGKIVHKGMDLWRDYMAGKESAWRTMERYNKRDVVILERVYKKVLPWIQPHPNHALFKDGSERVCPNCGGHHLQSRGYAYTNTQVYNRYQCIKEKGGCGKWSRERLNCTPEEHRAKILTGVK